MLYTHAEGADIHLYTHFWNVHFLSHAHEYMSIPECDFSYIPALSLFVRLRNCSMQEGRCVGCKLAVAYVLSDLEGEFGKMLREEA